MEIKNCWEYFCSGVLRTGVFWAVVYVLEHVKFSILV